MYGDIKYFYDLGYYSNEDVKVFVQAGWITAEEYQLITDEPYTV